MRRLVSALVLVLLAAACSAEAPAPAPAPAPTAAPAPAPAPATGPDLTGTRVLSPSRRLFSVSVPTRFTDLAPSSPEATAIPTLAEALTRGVGVLAVDRRDGYSPTAGGYCTLVQAQDLNQLAAESRQAIERSGSPAGPADFTVVPATGSVGPRVSGTYRTTSSGRILQVQQVAGLAGPGRACLLTVSTDDAARDAAVLTTARDTFRMAG